MRSPLPSGFVLYPNRLIFDDGLVRTINFEPILNGPVWGKLRVPSLFQQVKIDVESGTLLWPGEIDIDPTVLHDWPDHLAYIVEKQKRLSAPAEMLAVPL